MPRIPSAPVTYGPLISFPFASSFLKAGSKDIFHFRFSKEMILLIVLPSCAWAAPMIAKAKKRDSAACVIERVTAVPFSIFDLGWEHFLKLQLEALVGALHSFLVKRGEESQEWLARHTVVVRVLFVAMQVNERSDGCY